jgi:hypothetical protein
MVAIEEVESTLMIEVEDGGVFISNILPIHVVMTPFDWHKQHPLSLTSTAMISSTVKAESWSKWIDVYGGLRVSLIQDTPSLVMRVCIALKSMQYKRVDPKTRYLASMRYALLIGNGAVITFIDALMPLADATGSTTAPNTWIRPAASTMTTLPYVNAPDRTGRVALLLMTLHSRIGVSNLRNRLMLSSTSVALS